MYSGGSDPPGTWIELLPHPQYTPTSHITGPKTPCLVLKPAEFCRFDKTKITPYIKTMMLKPANTAWTDSFALDVALIAEGSGESITSLMEIYGYKPEDLEKFNNDDVFHQRVARYQEDIRVNGLGFKLKAQAQAEALLDRSWRIIHNQEVSPAVQADLIKHTVKWAGFEPRPDSGTSGHSGSVRISINLGGQEIVPATNANPVIEHEPDGN